MKKNVMMRVASALLVAVLMTTCAISGTFAKYTTTNTGSDSARVAKWGFEEETISFDLFKDAYGTDVNGNGEKVIAPGTSNQVEIDFEPAAATPEVAYTFDVTVEVVCENDVLLSKLNWFVGAPGNVQPVEYEDIQSAVNALYTGVISANSNPTNLVLGWEWPINTGDDTDTALGNDIANLAELTVNVTYVATQYTTP